MQNVALSDSPRCDRQRIQTVVFDFDGTIADTLDVLIQIVNELSIKFGYPPTSPQQVEQYKQLSSRQILRQSQISYFKLPFVIWKAQRELAFRMTQIQPCPDMTAVLQDLKAEGYQLGILTSNSRSNVETFLRFNQLEHQFDFIYSGLTVFGKERLFRKLLRQENLKPEHLVYVGDETRDIEAAKKVGVASIAVGWGFNATTTLKKHNPDRTVKTPRELLAAVNSLEKLPLPCLR